MPKRKRTETSVDIRYIAIDTGKIATGVAVVEASAVIHIALIETSTKDKPTAFVAHVAADLDSFVQDGTVVLLEKMYNANWTVIHRNKALREHFQAKGATVRYVNPMQKRGVTARKSNERKAQSVAAARELLKGDMLEKFEALSRKHDIADALLMISSLQ